MANALIVRVVIILGAEVEASLKILKSKCFVVCVLVVFFFDSWV